MYLECSNLSYTYPGSSSAVIDRLNFSMSNPGFNAIFGPSGVGKTSLAKILAGMVTQYDGIVSTQKIDRILYSYNQERLPGWSSTGRHLEKVTAPEKNELKSQLIKIFEVEEILGARFSKLSMGQQNRVNLIRYLLQDFDLLIMDESLANVDEKLREKILLSIKELFGQKMFMYISHNLMEVSSFCRQILVFKEPTRKAGAFMVNGLDIKTRGTLNKTQLDRTMLEIMNAF